MTNGIQPKGYGAHVAGTPYGEPKHLLHDIGQHPMILTEASGERDSILWKTHGRAAIILIYCKGNIGVFFYSVVPRVSIKAIISSGTTPSSSAIASSNSISALLDVLAVKSRQLPLLIENLRI
jgi:hypothetical protein